MQALLKIALLQYAPVPGDKEASIAKACTFIDEAAALGAQLLLLPEYFNTEYFAQFWDYAYLEYAESDTGPSLATISRKAADLKVYLGVNFYEDAGGGHLYNTTALLSPAGQIIGKYRKTHPAAIKSVEKIFFRYGTQFPVFPVLGWRIGFITSDDNFYPEAMRCVALAGADAILIPNAVIRGILWEEVFRTRGFENSAYVCVANRVGVEENFDFCGKSLIVDPFGELEMLADDQTEGAFICEMDINRVYDARKRFHLYRDRRPDMYGRIVRETDMF